MTKREMPAPVSHWVDDSFVVIVPVQAGLRLEKMDISTEGVIFSPEDGTLKFNAIQQDGQVIRLVFRSP